MVKLEICWNVVWLLAERQRERAKMRPCARKEASAQEVQGYHQQFAESKHLEYRSWVDNEVFDLIDMSKVNPRNYVTGQWVLTIKTDKQGNFLRAKTRWALRGFHGIQKESYRLIHKLPQGPDFGWVVKWQPAKDGIFFTLISKRLYFKDNPVMWTVMLCVNCHQKQVIVLTLLPDWWNLHVTWCRPTLVEHPWQGTVQLWHGSHTSWPMMLLIVLNTVAWANLETK